MTDTFEWDLLDFWGSSDWNTAQEKLDGLQRSGIHYNPDRQQLFAALDRCPFVSTKVAILGQDPYPDSRYCTGVAFSIPNSVKGIPSSLQNILTEYSNDLRYPWPRHGDLTNWCQEGALLWNCYPTCVSGKPGSHHWPEWETLTKEIVQRLDQRDRPCVFVCLGKVAWSLCQEHIKENEIIVTSHPSPLSANRGFLGSRIFSTVNASLGKYHEYVNWRLD